VAAGQRPEQHRERRPAGVDNGTITTLATYSNIDRTPSYVHKTLDVLA
jgi:hypothetical protein